MLKDAVDGKVLGRPLDIGHSAEVDTRRERGVERLTVNGNRRAFAIPSRVSPRAPAYVIASATETLNEERN